MSDESQSPHEEDSPDDIDESGAQEAASKARPRRSRSETPKPPSTRSVAPKSVAPAAPKSLAPKAAKSVAPRGVTPKPPGVASTAPVRGETPRPPGVRTSKPPSVAARETPKPPSVRAETAPTKSAGTRSRRPPAVKEKEPAPKARVTRSRKKAGENDPTDGHAQRFFAEGEAMSDEERRLTLHSQVNEHETDASQLGAAGIVPPHRRGAFLRYVGIAVAVCFLLCVAAVVRISLARDHAAEAPVVTATAPTAAAPPVEPVNSAAPAPSAAGPASAAAATPPPPQLEAPAEQASVAAPVPEVPAKSAVAEREDARKALERGKLDDAISAALRSTSLDPTDADAWLLLGAAYQTAGKAADARAAYGTCAKEAKRGAVRECQLMLR